MKDRAASFSAIVTFCVSEAFTSKPLTWADDVFSDTEHVAPTGSAGPETAEPSPRTVSSPLTSPSTSDVQLYAKVKATFLWVFASSPSTFFDTVKVPRSRV